MRKTLWKTWNLYQKILTNISNKKILKQNSIQKLVGYDGVEIDNSLLNAESKLYQAGKKILGLYEYEVKKYLCTNLMAKKYTHFLSIGASDGIEAWRIAKLLNISNICLCDTHIAYYEELWVKLFEKHNLECHGQIKTLDKLSILNNKESSKLMLIDIEGYEMNLFEATKISPNNTDIILEYHTSEIIDLNNKMDELGYKIINVIPIIPEFYRTKAVSQWVTARIPSLSTKEVNRLLFETRTYSVCWLHIVPRI